MYAASSSTYGDAPELPKVEDRIGRPLSPYAVTKYLNEIYADVFGRCYGTASIGLRYFNVFGARQDPEGAYAAVIPRWAEAMLAGRPIVIYGDGATTRDFCYVANVVQANLLAATSRDPAVLGQVYNVAVGGKMPLNALFATLRDHSQADIGKARRLLGYDPTYDVGSGLREALPWYEARLRRPTAGRREVMQGVDDVT